MKTKILIILFVFLWIPGLFFGQGLTIEPGAKVTVRGGGKVSIDGTGKIRIKSTASGTGSLVVDAHVNNVVSPAGGVEVQQYLTGSRWHLTSSPVPSETSGGVYLGNYLYRWDEPNTSWINIIATNYPLTPLEGFFVDSYPGNATALFTGSGINGLNNGTVGPYPLTRKDDNATSGYNLVGNPYPCSVDWMSSSGWTKTGISNEIWVYKDVDGTIENGYYTYFNGSGAPDSLLGGKRFIPPTQGFWVRVNTGNTAGSLSVNNNARVHGDAPFLKEGMTITPKSLRIKAWENNMMDEMVIKFLNGATGGEDEFDGHRFFGGSGRPQIYSEYSGNNPLCINALPDLLLNVTVPLSFKAAVSSVCTLEFDQTESFTGTTSIFLEDLKVNTFQDIIANNVYEFSYFVNDDPDRFLLHFNDAALACGDIQAKEDVRIYSFLNDVYVNILFPGDLKGSLTIYNMIGSEVFNSKMNNKGLNKFQPGLISGYYLVKVVTDHRVYSQTVFLCN